MLSMLRSTLPILIGLCVGIALPAILWWREYRASKGQQIVLCPREWVANPNWDGKDDSYVLLGNALVDFVPRLQQYTKTAEIAITLASASIVFVPSHISKHPWTALAMVLLGFSVVWGVSFIAWMSYCYEQALYNPDFFSAGKSSTMYALGFGALGCFALAYLLLAFVIAHALALQQTL